MSNNGQVVWEEPLTTKNLIDWDQALRPLTEHPGRWARVHETSSSKLAGVTATQLRKGRRRAIPPGRWEFTSRKAEGGKGYIYARYLGAEDEQP